MTVKQYRAFLNLLMCSDPWPTPDAAENRILCEFADAEAIKHGYTDWIDAYHRMPE